MLIDKSFDVPRIVARRDVSRSYRSEVSKYAAALGLPNALKNEMLRVVSSIVQHSSELALTPEAKKYMEDFERLEKHEVLVGLDRNPKAAAVMTESTYRAGMQDTYAKDVDHYEVILDAKMAKAIEDIQQRVWRALPSWMQRKPVKLGHEYLNLKEK